MAYTITSGISSNGIILSNDTMTIEAGGLVSNTKVYYGGMLYVSGTASDTTVLSGGQLYAQNGGTVIGAHVSSGGSMFFSAATGSDLTISNGGALRMNWGGIASNVIAERDAIIFDWGGRQLFQLESGADSVALYMTTSNCVYASGSLSGFSYSGNLVLNGGEGSGITANGMLGVNNGTYRNLNVDGTFYAGNGAVASGVHMTSGGGLEGNAQVTDLVMDNGTLNVTQNAVASQVLVKGGLLYAQTGGTVIGAKVSSGGSLFFSSATGNDLTIYNGGVLKMNWGGIANDVIVERGANIFNWAGQRFFDLESGADSIELARVTSECAYASGSLSGFAYSGNLSLLAGEFNDITGTGTLTAGSGVVASGLVLNGTGTFNGDASITDLVLNGGNVDVQQNAVVTQAVVNSGLLYARNGGTVIGAEVTSGGSMIVSSATGNGLTVFNGGQLRMNWGGIANNVIVERGAIILNWAGQQLFNLESGANSVELFQVTNDCAYGSGSLGGFAYSGNLTLLAGEFNDITGTGTLTAGSGAVASGLVLNGTGTFNGNASITDIVLNGGNVDVQQNAVVSQAVVNNGLLYARNGGTVIGGTVNSGGSMLFSSATGEGLTISDGGQLRLNWGGIVNNAFVERGATIFDWAGRELFQMETGADGIALYLVTSNCVYGNSELSGFGYSGNLVLNGGEYSDITANGMLGVNNGTYQNLSVDGTFYAGSGALVSGVHTTSGGGIDGDANVTGLVLDGGTLNVSQSAVVSQVVVNGGLLLASRGGTVNDAVVNSGGSMIVSSATGNGLTISNGGQLQMSWGGIANNVIVEHGATLLNWAGWQLFNLESGANSVELFQVTSDCAYASGSLGGFAYSGNLSLQAGEYSDITGTGTLVAGSGVVASGLVLNGTGTFRGDAQVTDIVLNSGTMTVSQSAVVSQVVVNGGLLLASMGGTVNDAVVNSGGSMVVSSATGNGLTISNGGQLLISHGGIATDVTLEQGALLLDWGGRQLFNLESGPDNVELARVTSICTYAMGNLSGITYTGTLALLAGEYSDITAKGTLHAGSDVVASGIRINEGGGTFDGNAKVTALILDSGTLNVRQSAVVSRAVVINSGMLYALSGGSVIDADVSSGGSMIVSSSTVSGLTVCEGGRLLMSHGGVANDVTAEQGGLLLDWGGRQLFRLESGTDSLGLYRVTSDYAYISGGLSGFEYSGRLSLTAGEYSDITANGSMSIASGASATGIEIVGGNLNAASGAEVGMVTLTNGASIQNTIQTLAGLTLNSAAHAISSGRTVSDGVVNNGGSLIVSSSGLLLDAEINEGGVATVANQGRASSVNVFFGGEVRLAGAGNRLEDCTVRSGGIFSVSGGSASGVVLDNGAKMNLSLNNSTTVYGTARNGAFTIENGVAQNILITSGGRFSLATSGCSSLDMTVEEGALFDITLRAGDSSTLVTGINESGAFRIEGNSATNLVIHSGGRIQLDSGTSVLNLKICSGGTINGLLLEEELSFASVADGMVDGLSGAKVQGSALIQAGLTVDDLSVYGSGRLNVSGTVRDVKVSSGGSMSILDGGLASGVSTDSGVRITVLSGGSMADAYLSGGQFGSNTVEVQQGGVISGARVVDGFDLLVAGSAYCIVLSDGKTNSDLSDLFLQSGGYAENVSMYKYGYYIVSSGATANSTHLNARGGEGYAQNGFVVSNGAVVNNTFINEGGLFQVTNGFTASGATVNRGGRLEVASGAVIEGVVENGGWVEANANATVTYLSNTIPDLLLESGGSATLHSGTTAMSVDVNNGGSLRVCGGVASSTSISGAANIQVLDGGLVFITTMDSGSITVSGGGSASFDNTVFTNSASIIIDGTAGVDMNQISGTATLLVKEGSTLRIQGSDLSQVKFIFAGPGTFDLSGNYWGTTDVNEIYARLSVDSSTVVIDDLLPTDPTTRFGICANSLMHNYIKDGTSTITFTFTHEIDARTVSADDISFVSAAGDTVSINGIQVDGKQLTVQFAPVAAEGNYRVTFADSILDIAGEALTTLQENALEEGIGEAFDLRADFTAPTVLLAMPDEDWDNTGSLTNFTVYFSEAVDFSSVAQNVRLVTPNGIVVLPTACTAVSDSVIEITVPEQVVPGSYQITVSGDVTDYAGNKLGQVYSFGLSIVEPVIPDAPVVSADITETTKSDVAVTAVFGESSVFGEYSLDGRTWQKYTGAVVFTENGIVYFRSFDAAGNVSEVTSYEVTNIAERVVSYGVSNFIVPETLTPGETATFQWTLTNSGDKPASNVWQMLYVVDAGNPARKTLLRSNYLVTQPESGESSVQTMKVAWNDKLGFANSYFQVVVNADGDVTPDNNTAVSASGYSFKRELSIGNLNESITENAGRIRLIAKRTGSPDSALTASITLEDSSGMVSAPETVTFAAGESEKVFYLTVGDNSEYQGDSDIQIELQAQGYEGYSQTVNLMDDELPSLSFEVVSEELTEGDSYDVFGKVKLDHALDHDLRVRIAYDKTQLSGIPDYVVINAGETETAFALTVIDDVTAEIDKTVKLTASADGVNNATKSLLIKDNDVPAIALSINKTVVSENEGVYALVGTITRTDDSVNYVKVRFTDVNKSGLILPDTVTLGTGAQSVNFYIGIVDNALVDGDRTATVKASIYIDSCGCTVQPVSGETQVSFTILDDDGEALGLSFNKSNVAENTAGAAKLTITRNTVNGAALTVNLSVTGTPLLELPETVRFEAGQTSITIDVNTLTDGVNSGNQMAVVTATAEGYASTATYLNISDVDLPDLVISNVSLGEAAYAGKTTLVNLTLANNGFLAYSGKVDVKLKLSDGTDLGTYKVNGPFEIGETKQVGFYVNMPEITGSRTILAEIDPDNQVLELNDGNNTAVSASFNVSLDYIVTVETEPEVMYAKAPITVTGATKRLDGTAIGNMAVEVSLRSSAGEKRYSTTSDADGNYSLLIDTSDLYAGSYTVYAGYLNSFGNAQDLVEIAGMKLKNSGAITWDMENMTSTSGKLTISNLCGVALSGVTVRAVNAPDNFVFVADEPAALDANGQLVVNYTVTAAGETEGGGYELTRGWQKIDFVAESEEGVTTEFSGYFYSSPQTAVLTLSESKDVRTLYSGGEYYYEFQITNTGFGDTGAITLHVPGTDLLKLISNPVIENLAYGESATVTLKIDPGALGDDLALNAPYAGSIGISAQNAKSRAFDFGYTFITNNTGSISVTLTDDWTQHAADHPMLSGAKVSVYNAYTEKLVATAYSDENGKVNFSDLAEGKYILKYFAEGHNDAQEVLTIHGGETLERDIFLQVCTVNYTWEVRRVELTDTYEIVLSTEFQTNVPAPVVTITGPTVLPDLALGESSLMSFTVTNHGLIAAQDFTLVLPEIGNGYSWRVLDDQPVDIAPNSAIPITVLLERTISELDVNYTIDNDCRKELAGYYVIVCDGEEVNRIPYYISTQWCNAENYESYSSYYYYGGGGGGGSVPARGGGGGGGGGSVSLPSISATDKHCYSYFEPGSSAGQGGGSDDNICAHVRVEFKQTAVMSREGFEGVLTLTNRATTEMSNIAFTATVLNSAGEDVSDLFEIAYNGADGFSITQDGDLTQYGLGYNGVGAFTVLYVPGRNTATEGPEDYQFTGTLTYTDSRVGEISIDLTPVTLTVNPSPALRLHYFVERDVYADDPFTEAIEASIPAEISVLVVNAGKGDARNFSLSGLTPEIVDNPKGLLLNYTMTDAAMNGVKNNNGIANVNFGTITAGSSAVAQWWYETNIQGHYSDYSVNFTQMDYSYVDLYGNVRYVAAANRPDVSLIESADIHELIRSVQCGDDELPDFLVNDLEDSGDTPDTLYLSTGAVEDVNAVSAAVSSGRFGTTEVTITLTANFEAGWNYLRILDPGNGDYELTGVTRNGESLNARNFWQTDRYYVDELGVTYENRLHLLDYSEQAGTAEFTLTYTARDKNPLAVISIDGTEAIMKSAVDSLTVTFNKAVNAASFTWEDLDLFRQGELSSNLITDAVTVTKISDTVFRIGNLGDLTSEDGYYQLIVRTDAIADMVGNVGSDGKALAWTMASGVPAVAAVEGIDDVMNSKTDSVVISFTYPPNPATITPSVFRVNGVASENLVVTPVENSYSKYVLSGLSGLLTEGENVLEIDLTQVAGINGNIGLQTWRTEWTVDMTAPQASVMSEYIGAMKTAPDKLVFEVSEDVSVDPGAFVLKKDGTVIASDSLHVSVEGREITVSGIVSGLDGVYELSMDLAGLSDAAGNVGSGAAVKTWTIDRTAPEKIDGFSLAASCDLGESDSDGKTSTRDLTLVGTLPEAGLRVRIYQQSGNTRTFLREITPDGLALEAAVKVQPGHSTLVAELIDAAGNTSETSLSVFVDELAVATEFLEKFEEALDASPTAITVKLSEAVSELTADNFSLHRDGKAVSLDGAAVVQLDDLTYSVTGINADANGEYTLTLDLSGAVKTSTGFVGGGTQSVQWVVNKPEAPTVVFTSLDPSELLDELSTFSIVFSAPMNCAELISSGAISYAVQIAKVNQDGSIVAWYHIDSEDFQYINETNTLIWSSDPFTEPGIFLLVLDTHLLKSAEGIELEGDSVMSRYSYQVPQDNAQGIQAGAYAVPVWYDYNGDGKLDLLVGERPTETEGRIRVLLNVGTEEAPSFNDFSYLPGVSGDWTIEAANCLGVAFRFADVNGDGADDLVYGTSDGRIEYALNTSGVFGNGIPLMADGTAIDIGNRAVLDLVDWNGDGALDIVSGAMDGKIYLFVNNGDWTFGASQTLDIQVENGWSAPAVADLDGDGLLDVVSGDAKGGLHIFMNNGDGTFAEVAAFSGESSRSRPFIADVDSDGLPDITVGYADGSVFVLYGEEDRVLMEVFRINAPPVFSGKPVATVEDFQVTISWDPASDDAGVAGYKVKLGDVIYDADGTSLTVKDLNVGIYEYQICAYDASGLEGWTSVESFEIMPPVPPDRHFFVGDLTGSGKPMLAVLIDNSISFYADNVLYTGMTLDEGWNLAGIGDFNGDGLDDILRTHSTGLLIGDASDGAGWFESQVLNLKGDDWDILGIGDFNADGMDDVLVANPTGASDTIGLLGYWSGGTEWILINGYSPEWEMVSTGDFNADGGCDMLWRNTFEGEDGQIYNAYCTWIMDPPEGEPDWRFVSVAASAEWDCLCTGDFDGNGAHDIAMINQDGVVGIWGIEDGWLSSWSILSAVDTSAWTLAGVADFNGDGTDDIAWCSNATGLVGYWQINDKSLTTWQNIATLA